MNASRTTIQGYQRRARAAGLIWPLLDDVTDEVLQARLFARTGRKSGLRHRPEPGWALLLCELKRPGVTLQILREEYRTTYPQGHGYSRFCDLIRGFQKRLSPVKRPEALILRALFVSAGR